ncbi:RNA polymerase sigma factor [Pseudoalteromonas aurantia]|uniref:RNA polymerase sigma factor n=1 Tax=Pseudoalteromonas aurantia TaxID=43654 RepID=UPI00298F39C0|nr:sigma-70 family RNA polymerase sigma factor [Pseudoalteromonas aurantia]
MLIKRLVEKGDRGGEINRMNSTEIALQVLDAQSGDKQAFSKLCDALYQPSFRFALKLAKQQDFAKDVTQEAWVTVAKDIKSLREPSAFKAWLFKVVYRRFIDAVRKKTDFEPLTDELLANTAPEQEYDLLNLINKLPDIDRHTVYLFYFEQMTMSDIAIVLGVAGGTVKSRLHRARSMLAQLASDEDQEGEY